MSFTYHSRQGSRLGFWHSDDPSLNDIEDMFFANGGTRKSYHRMRIHGEPCERSPEWVYKHPEEGLAGKMTATYAIPTGTIGIWLYGTNSQGLTPQNAVDFFNGYLNDDFDSADPCQDGSCDSCWKTIEWVEWVEL